MKKKSKTAQLLVDILGHRMALAFIAHLNSNGKGYMYVPVFPKNGCDLIKTLGLNSAHKLCSVFGGRSIRAQKRIDISKRDDEIKLLYGSGKTQKDVARLFGMTVRQVRNVLAKSV